MLFQPLLWSFAALGIACNWGCLEGIIRLSVPLDQGYLTSVLQLLLLTDGPKTLLFITFCLIRCPYKYSLFSAFSVIFSRVFGQIRSNWGYLEGLKGGGVGGKGGIPRNVQNQDYSTMNPVKKSEKWSFWISRVWGYSQIHPPSIAWDSLETPPKPLKKAHFSLFSTFFGGFQPSQLQSVGGPYTLIAAKVRDGRFSTSNLISCRISLS